MPLYNVEAPVIANVQASSPAEARLVLRHALTKAGWVVDSMGEAFLSEDQDEEPDLRA